MRGNGNDGRSTRQLTANFLQTPIRKETGNEPAVRRSNFTYTWVLISQALSFGWMIYLIIELKTGNTRFRLPALTSSMCRLGIRTLNGVFLYCFTFDLLDKKEIPEMSFS